MKKQKACPLKKNFYFTLKFLIQWKPDKKSPTREHNCIKIDKFNSDNNYDNFFPQKCFKIDHYQQT